MLSFGVKIPDMKIMIQHWEYQGVFKPGHSNFRHYERFPKLYYVYDTDD